MIKKFSEKKELLWVVVSQVIQVLGGALIIKLLSSNLSKGDYGLYSLSLTIFTLISIIPFTAFDQGVYRYMSIYKKEGTAKKYYSNIFFGYLIIYSTYILLWFIIKNIIGIDSAYVSIGNILMFYIITEILKNTIISIETANRERKRVALAKICEYFAKISLIICINSLSILKVENILISFSIINFFIIVIIWIKNKEIFCLSEIRFENMKILVGDIWIFSYPFVIWGIFGWLQNTATKWLINGFLNPEALAEFSIMTSLAFIPPNAIQNIVNSFIMPIVYEKENTEKGYARNTMKKLIPIISLLYFVGIFIVYFLKDFIVKVFADEKYLNSAWMLPVMMFATCLFSLSIISALELLASKKTKKLILPNILPGISSLVLGYILVKNFAMIGAVINFIVTYCIYAYLMFTTLKKHIKENKLEWSR